MIIEKCIVKIAVMMITACLTLFAGGTLSVNAAENQYRIDSADFRVDLEKNGDAVITEHWTVTYEKGEFTHFYKDVYNAPNKLEYIKDLQITGCRINGEEAELSQSDDRADGQYYLETAEEKYTINWYKSASDETVTYDVTYRIPDAVKLDEKDRAEFCFRLIGENFEMKTDKVSAVVNMPSEDSSAVSSAGGVSGEADGRSFYFSKENASGVYKVRMDMSGLGFTGLKRIDDVNVPFGFMRSAKMKTFFGTVKIIFICIGAVIAVLFVYLFFISPAIAEKKIKKMLDDDPDHMQRKADEIGSCCLPFVWYIMPPIGKNQNKRDKLLAFFFELFDLKMKGYIEIEPEGIKIKDNSDYTSSDAVQDRMDRDFLERLDKMITLNGETPGDFISFGLLKKAAGNRVLFTGQMQSWVENYEKALPESTVYMRLESDNKLEELTKNLSFWRNYGHYVNKRVSMLDCFELVMRTNEIDTFTFLLLICTKSERVTVTEKNALADFLKYTDRNYDSSGNMYGSMGRGSGGGGNSGSGSGCASCGGCGGCGGGGAN